jgi:hypothetical protein
MSALADVVASVSSSGWGIQLALANVLKLIHHTDAVSDALYAYYLNREVIQLSQVKP